MMRATSPDLQVKDDPWKEKEDEHPQYQNHPIGLYIHIPYCRRRCHYCDFAIVPIGIIPAKTVGGGGDDDGRPKNHPNVSRDVGFEAMNERYMAAVCQELKGIIHPKQGKIPLQSIYFGGGTPSLAPVDSIRQILQTALWDTDAPFVLQQHHTNSTTSTTTSTNNADAEVTMEMDPGTFTLEQLQALKDLGINRISLGVQSFSDDVLEGMGRVHRKTDVLEAVQLIRQVYVDDDDGEQQEQPNYSIDLISGAPGISLGVWSETLHDATTLLDPPPTHISVYDLQVEQGTVFGKLFGSEDDKNEPDDDARSGVPSPIARKRAPSGSSSRILKNEDGSKEAAPTSSAPTALQLPSEEDCAFMYQFTSGYLKRKGYEHYEVSSYAFTGNSSTRTKQPEDNIAVDGSLATANASNTTNNHSNDNHCSMRSRHNQIYWAPRSSWYAVGLGSTSSVNGIKLKRPRQMADYIRWVDQGQDEKQDTEKETKVDRSDNKAEADISNDAMDQLEDLLLKRLRTSDGLDLTLLQQMYSDKVVDAVLRGASLGLELGLAEIPHHPESTMLAPSPPGRGVASNERGRKLKLTSPNGFLYSNFIISSVFAELDDIK